MFSLLLLSIQNALETKIARRGEAKKDGKERIMEQLQILHVGAARGGETGVARRWGKAKLDYWSCMQELREAERLGQQGDWGKAKLDCWSGATRRRHG
jgi:hypothetical protein